MILVTGARGTLGKVLVARLEAMQMPVCRLNRGRSLALEGSEWTADLTDPDHCAALGEVAEFPTTVVHLAGHVEIQLRANPEGEHPLPGREDLSAIYAGNVLATANLIGICARQNVEHVIFASSQAVYGYPTLSGELHEDSPCRPLEHYALSKHCAEQMLERASYAGLAVTALRIPGVYGEHRAAGVVHRFCADALRHRMIEVRSDIALPIDVIHIDDLVEALALSVSSAPVRWRIMNVSTGEPCSLPLLAHDVASLVEGCTVVDRSVAQPVIALSAARAREELGWQARPRRERLAQMLQSVRNGNAGAHA